MGHRICNDAYSLKWKCYFDEFFNTGCAGSCQNEKFQCSEYWQFRQNDISVSLSCLIFHWKHIICTQIDTETEIYHFDDIFITGCTESCQNDNFRYSHWPQIARFIGPTWGPPGSCRPQMGPTLAPWTLLTKMLAKWRFRFNVQSKVHVYSPCDMKWVIQMTISNVTATVGMWGEYLDVLFQAIFWWPRPAIIQPMSNTGIWRVNLAPPGQMATFSLTIFSDAFSWIQSFVFRLKFHRSSFLRVLFTMTQRWFRWWLVPNRRQSIIWTNADLIHWRIYAALGCWIYLRKHKNTFAFLSHYYDVMMSAMASQITSLTIVYPIINSGADQRKHQSSASLNFCSGNSQVTGEFHSQRPVKWSYDLLFDLHLNKRLIKQTWGWWFETQSRSLWRHCNGQQTMCMLRSLACSKIVCERTFIIN